MEDNEFVENFASYGDNIGSYSIRLTLDIYEVNDKKHKLIYSSLAEANQANLSNINPGNIIPYILKFCFIDIYGQVIETLNQ